MQNALSLMGFAALQYTFLGVLALVAWLLGSLFVRRDWYTSQWEQASHATALGLGMLAHLLFFLGSLGLLYRSAVGGVVVLVLGLGWRRWWPQARELLTAARRLRPLQGLGVLLVLGFAVPMLLLPLLPPTTWDAIQSYLRWSWLYVDQHQLIPTPNLRMVVYPHLNTMLFTLGLLFANDLAAQLTQSLMLLVTAAALVGTGTRLFSARAGWWAAALLAGSPVILLLSSVAYIDMGLTLFLTVAALTFLRWFEEGERHWLLLSAAFFGFAASAKHNALPLFALIGVVILWKALMRRQFGHVVLFGLLGLAVMAPSYVRAAYYTGNPFYPLLPGIFGYSYLSPADMKHLFDDLNLTRREGLRAVFEVPWFMTFKPHLVRAEAPLSPGYLAALPFLLVGAWKDRWVRALLLVFGVQAVVWFTSSQLIRHLVPGLPLLSLAVGGALHRVLPLFEGRGPRLLRTGAVAVLALVLLLPARNFARHQLPQEGVPVTAEQREQFLLRALPSYASYKLLNERKGRQYSVYALFDENMAYFAQGNFMGDHFGPVRYTQVREAMATGESLYKTLRRLGADHFLINRARCPDALPQDAFFQSHFTLLHAQADHLLYALTDTPQPLKVSSNLIRNPGFDDLYQGRPRGWGQTGTPEVIIEPDGQTRVKGLGDTNVFHQEVPVTGGHLYFLGFRARSASSEAQQARLQVNWMDASGQFLPASAQIITVDTEWKSYEMPLVAPPEAHRGSIPATPHGDGQVLFDDFRLVERSDG